ncbi:uncharacterized protein RCO7_02718 [Rhynchosporium graminicola]|uniref:Uncharacterized protein n=1 Tax=Rhynchosporium graminicola TaxID=2792576 RepID=A0A1E1KG22_9HELO|nr:uncharacterized protein RCO7_02718 [Rhynchosporium commune]
MEQALPDSNPEMQSTECIAIGDYWPGHCDITAEEIEEFLHGAQGPLPTEDDFADEPPPTPFNPENGIYEWARADAWVEEKDSKGRTVWRNRILGTTENSRPAVLDPKIQMTDKQDKEGLSCPLEQPKEK